jgi:hypothetical protein
MRQPAFLEARIFKVGLASIGVVSRTTPKLFELSRWHSCIDDRTTRPFTLSVNSHLPDNFDLMGNLRVAGLDHDFLTSMVATVSLLHALDLSGNAIAGRLPINEHYFYYRIWTAPVL